MQFVPTKDIRPLLRDTLKTAFRLEPMASGLLNQNLLVEGVHPSYIGGGRGRYEPAKFVFKIYRPEMPQEKVDDMHRMMTHVSRRDIPVALPIATYSLRRSPLLFKEGQGVVTRLVASMYPFVEGEHPPRFGGGVKRAEAMGEMLGRVDAALTSFRPTGSKPTSLELAKWDPHAFAGELAAIRASLRGRSRRTREDAEGVLAMHEAILSKGDWDKRPFAHLPIRVCHDDYHMYNLLMRDGKIAAVLDWEKAGWDWRAFEAARSVMFTCRRSDGAYCWDNVRAFLGGYRRHAGFSDRERELAFACGLNRAFFSLWAVKEYASGRAEMRDHLLRRAKLLPYLFKHRKEFGDRIAKLLA